jgi:hypothetical protein
MKSIFKLEVKNKNIKDLEPMYFLTFKDAIIVSNAFDSLAKEGIKFKWKCTEIELLSSSDVINHLLSLDSDSLK